MSPELVTFTKSSGPLTKKISLDDNGRVISDGSACVMARGVTHRKAVGNVEQLGALISDLKNNQALRSDLANPVGVAAKRLLVALNTLPAAAFAKALRHREVAP
jgi:hypothetical protein